MKEMPVQMIALPWLVTTSTFTAWHCTGVQLQQPWNHGTDHANQGTVINELWCNRYLWLLFNSNRVYLFSLRLHLFELFKNFLRVLKLTVGPKVKYLPQSTQSWTSVRIKLGLKQLLS